MEDCFPFVVKLNLAASHETEVCTCHWFGICRSSDGPAKNHRRGAAMHVKRVVAWSFMIGISQLGLAVEGAKQL